MFSSFYFVIRTYPFTTKRKSSLISLAITWSRKKCLSTNGQEGVWIQSFFPAPRPHQVITQRVSHPQTQSRTTSTPRSRQLSINVGRTVLSSEYIKKRAAHSPKYYHALLNSIHANAHSILRAVKSENRSFGCLYFSSHL